MPALPSPNLRGLAAAALAHSGDGHRGILDWIAALLDSIHDAILVVDSSGKIIYANKSYTRIFGVPVDKVLGRRLADIEPDAQLLRVLSSGKPVLHGYERIHSVGKSIVGNLTPITLADGRILGAVAVFEAAPDTGADKVKRAESRSAVRLEQNTHKSATIIGQSDRLRELMAEVERIARHDVAVLIQGETGAGKELIARAIHEGSSRRQRPFVAINCAAIPESLMESELFGYEVGAFTGARPGGKRGKMEIANGGTLFLDEVGDLPLALQAKLLRALQEREIEPVGGLSPRRVDVRVISATNQNLPSLVRQGRFRQDLFYRLAVVQLTVPSLRERLEDIPLLVQHFVQKYRHLCGCTPRITQDFIQCLKMYPWPGNIRQLENAIIYSIIRSEGEDLRPDHLPKEILDDIQVRYRRPEDGNTLRERLRRAEKEAILTALSAAKGNRSKAIRMLQISRAAFYRKVREYGLEAHAALAAARKEEPDAAHPLETQMNS